MYPRASETFPNSCPLNPRSHFLCWSAWVLATARASHGEGCYLANGDVHFTAPRTNQILIGALIRGHSTRPEIERREGRRRRRWKEARLSLFLPRIILCGFASGAFRRTFVSRPYLGRSNNYYYSRPRLLQFYLAAPPILPPSHGPCRRRGRSLRPRSVHNYEHVTRLISCLNSPLRLHRPISSSTTDRPPFGFFVERERYHFFSRVAPFWIILPRRDCRGEKMLAARR